MKNKIKLEVGKRVLFSNGSKGTVYEYYKASPTDAYAYAVELDGSKFIDWYTVDGKSNQDCINGEIVAIIDEE